MFLVPLLVGFFEEAREAGRPEQRLHPAGPVLEPVDVEGEGGPDGSEAARVAPLAVLLPLHADPGLGALAPVS